jgi:hypothetical protein
LKFETGWAKMEDPIAKYMVQVVEHLPSKHGALVQAQVLLKRKKKERKKKRKVSLSPHFRVFGP